MIVTYRKAIYLVTIFLSSTIYAPLAMSNAIECAAKNSVILKEDVSKKIQKQASDWTILTYIQADNNLAPFAEYNIHEMQRVYKSENINMLIQWHLPRLNTVHRYKLTLNGLDSEREGPKTITNNPEFDVINAMRWAASKYPAKHYMLVLWNHGNGILDQSWERRNIRGWRDKPLRGFPWLEIPGLESVGSRGILYSETNNNYMNNQQLERSLKVITENVIKQKIDIIGMDACLMSMLEVGYQVKPYANYLVASQNSEPGKGWNYAAILKSFNKRSTIMAPEVLAKKIVTTYEKFYHKRISFYTQSVIDLTKLDDLTDNVNSVVKAIEHCGNLRKKNTKLFVTLARGMALRFDTPSYIDLHSFYEALLKLTRGKRSTKIARPKMKSHYDQGVDALRKLLKRGKKIIEGAVPANVVGTRMKRARGISIYYPRYGVHSSYAKTRFAQENLWMRHLKEYRR